MEMNAESWRYMRMAVMDKDGTVEHLRLPVQPNKAGNGKGEVIYPFKQTPVCSDGWRASDHVRLILKDDEEN